MIENANVARPGINVYLRNVYPGQRIIIPGTDSVETLARADDLFIGKVPTRLLDWGLDVPGLPTSPTRVSVLEQIEDGELPDIFGSIGELDKLCLQQGQIKGFCQKHPRKLGGSTFFLFKVDARFFVARVNIGTHRPMRLDVGWFSLRRMLSAKHRHRFVVPNFVLK